MCFWEPLIKSGENNLQFKCMIIKFRHLFLLTEVSLPPLVVRLRGDKGSLSSCEKLIKYLPIVCEASYYLLKPFLRIYNLVQYKIKLGFIRSPEASQFQLAKHLSDQQQPSPTLLIPD